MVVQRCMKVVGNVRWSSVYTRDKKPVLKDIKREILNFFSFKMWITYLGTEHRGDIRIQKLYGAQLWYCHLRSGTNWRVLEEEMLMQFLRVFLGKIYP